MKILIIVGTRPNFIKITRFKKLSGLYKNMQIKVAHTGQHFDKEMAEVFFQQLDIYPDYFLNAKGNGVIGQFADIMVKLDNLIENKYQPDLLIVPGDVNSTLAAALVGNKRKIKIAHLESGLRSSDRDMPEEINRILTDAISDYYFITEESGLKNLINSEMVGEKFFVGNTMIDTLIAFQPEIDKSTILIKLGLENLLNEHALITLHRPSNVDNSKDLLATIEIVEMIAARRKVVFPIHPRTKKNLEKFGLLKRVSENDDIVVSGPLDYFAFQKLIKNSKYVVTDSGGIQEETSYYKIPCLTLRKNTERPSTIEVGTNTLLNFEKRDIIKAIELIENGEYKKGEIPKLWDGKSTERILKIVSELKI